MSKLRKEFSEDPLSLFVSSAEAEDLSNRAKQSAVIVSQKYAQTMSRIGASASDLFAENLSFGDPLSRLPNPVNNARPPQRDSENDQQSRQCRIPAPSHENINMSPLKQSTTAAEETCLESNQACRKEIQADNIHGQVYSSNSPLRGTGTADPAFRCPEQTTQRPSVENFANENFVENADNDTKYLSGESPISNIAESRIQIMAGRSITGNLILTNYRLKFVVSKKLLNSINSPSLYSYLNIPLGCIDKIEKEKKTKEQKLYEQKMFNLHNSSNSTANISSNTTISITCKDMRLLRITMPYSSTVHSRGNNSNNNNNNNNNNTFCQESNREADIENFIQTIAEVAFPNDRRGLFAFSHKLAGIMNLSSNVSSSNGNGNGNGNGNSDIISSNSSSSNSSSNGYSNNNSNNNSCRAVSTSYPQGSQQVQVLGQGQGSGTYSPGEPYSIMNEYKRLGVLDIISVTEKTEKSPLFLFRVSSANTNYSLCSTYPQALVVPSRMSDEEIQQSANFRSGHRLPVLCWGDKESGVTMWRSSQPKSGVSGACAADERLLDLIAQSCVYKRTPTGSIKVIGDPLLCIIDCRPKASAIANKAAGAGYESQNNYPNTQIYFNNIGNIHIMRESYSSLCALLLSPIPILNDINFTKQVEDTNYLTNIRLILKCSLETVTFIKKNLPVLVHCSHGWDRTAQVTALSQLFLDPFYRTIDGFKVLVEKEFLSFGHQFFLRCGHGLNHTSSSRSNYTNSTNSSNVKQDDQLSPIFFQFLDCTWQLLKQFVHYFEFNSRYLLVLADHIHSCRFGAFLFDSDLERDMFQSKEFCADIWTYLNRNRRALTNPLYMDPYLENTPTTHSLIPPLSQLLRNVTLWTDYFFRYCPLPTIVTPPTQLSQYLYESGVVIPAYCQEDTQTSPTQHLDGPAITPRSVPCPDFELPSMVTSDDFWESAFRREVQRNRDSSSTSFSSSSSSSSRNNLISSRTDRGRREGESEGEGDDVATGLSSVPPLSSSIPVVRSSEALQGHSRDRDRDRIRESGRESGRESDRERGSNIKDSVMTIERQKLTIDRLLSLLRDRGMTSEELELEVNPDSRCTGACDGDFSASVDGTVTVTSTSGSGIVSSNLECGDYLVGEGHDLVAASVSVSAAASAYEVNGATSVKAMHHSSGSGSSSSADCVAEALLSDDMCDIDIESDEDKRKIRIDSDSERNSNSHTAANSHSKSSSSSSSRGSSSGSGSCSRAPTDFTAPNSLGPGPGPGHITPTLTPISTATSTSTVKQDVNTSRSRLDRVTPDMPYPNPNPTLIPTPGSSEGLRGNSIMKLSSVDLLSALTSITCDSESRLFGSQSQSVSPRVDLCTAADGVPIVESKRIMNEFY